MTRQPFGILLIHGFSSNPENYRELRPSIQALGVPYRVPCLRGHGKESPEAMRPMHWEYWLEDAAQALEDLLAEAERAILIGHSMGGWIALNLSIDYRDRVDSLVVAGSAPGLVTLYGPGRPLNALVPIIVRLIPKWDMPPVYTDMTLAPLEPSYRWLPTVAIAEMFGMLRFTEKRIARVSAPILILQSRKDTSTRPAAAQRLYDTIATPDGKKRLVWFEQTEHGMFLDCERAAVNQVILSYVNERMVEALVVA